MPTPFPGLRGPLQKFQRTAVPRNHLRKGQGKFIGDADLHQKFQKITVPLHHHMVFQISSKSLHNLLRQFRDVYKRQTMQSGNKWRLYHR